MTVTLRPLSEDNVGACCALEISDTQKNHSQITKDIPDLLEELIEDPLTTVLTIYSGDTMVGLIAYGPHEGTRDYEITYLLIDEKHQGRGHGKSALQQMINLLCETPNCDRIKIKYMEFNIPAIRLYQQAGFVEVSNGCVPFHLRGVGVFVRFLVICLISLTQSPGDVHVHQLPRDYTAGS